MVILIMILARILAQKEHMFEPVLTIEAKSIIILISTQEHTFDKKEGGGP